MAYQGTRSKAADKKNQPITNQPESTTKTSRITVPVTSKKVSGGGKPGPSGGQASVQSGKALSHAEQKKKVPNLEECLKAKEEEVTRLLAEKESALKDERDRMEMKLQEKVEKVELEKDGLLNLIKTTKERNTALEEELEKIKEEVLEAEGDKKVLEGELQRLENEVKRIQEEKDQSNKEFTALREAMERIEVEQGALYEKMNKVEQDKREAVDEANQLKKKVKHLQELLYKERAEKQQLVDKGQKLDVKVKQPTLSSKDDEEEDDFHSFNDEDSPRAGQQPLGPDAIEKHTVVHMESVGKSVNALQKKRSGSQENIADSWVKVDESATCDDDPQKVSEKGLQEVIKGLKGQLEQAEAHRKTELEIQNRIEKEKMSLREECKTLRRRIQEMEVKMSKQGLFIDEHQAEPKRSGPLRLMEQDKSKHSLPSETTDTRAPSMGEINKLETPTSVRRQHSYDAAVSISVTPAEMTESTLHRSLESRNPPRRTPSPTEGQQPGLAKQDFNFTIVENLRKQLTHVRGELNQLRQEKELLEASQDKDNVQELKKELKDAKETIDSLEKRLAKEIKSRKELEEENLNFKQIINQFQADFNAERKDREGAAGTFADREKEWMEEIRRTGEERDHLKALTTQLQDQTNHQKHDMERLEKELKESREMADGISKKMTNQEISFKKQETDHHKQVQALHKQLEKLNKDVTKLKAELADKNKDARGSKAIEEAYGRLFDEKNNLECKVGALEQTKTIATQHIQELTQENKTLKAEVEGTRQHLLRTSQELQGVRTQYHVLSSQTISLKEENEKLKQRMPTSQHQQQVYRHPIPAEESSYQSLPRMPSGPGQIVRQDYRPHLQYGDVSRPQYDQMQYHPHGGSPHSQDRDLEEKDSPPSSTQPGHAHLVPHTDPVTRTPSQDPRSPPYTGGVMGNSPANPYTPQTVPGVPQGRGVGRGMLQLGLSNQQQQQQQQYRQPLPRAHSTPERQESDVSSESILPSPMNSRPGQDSMTYGSDTSFQPNQRYIGDEINREISHEARQYKKAVEQGVPAPDDIDESIWPFDPNLECAHCGKKFRRGQIREYRYHLDDEHAP